MSRRNQEEAFLASGLFCFSFSFYLPGRYFHLPSDRAGESFLLDYLSSYLLVEELKYSFLQVITVSTPSNLNHRLERKDCLGEDGRTSQEILMIRPSRSGRCLLSFGNFINNPKWLRKSTNL